MNKVEMLLVGFGVLLLAIAAVLLVAYGNLAHCVGLASGGCQEVGFAYEGSGKLALLLGFVMFLCAALHGILRGPIGRAQ